METAIGFGTGKMLFDFPPVGIRQRIFGARSQERAPIGSRQQEQ
jgi:hypothetical protein